MTNHLSTILRAFTVFLFSFGVLLAQSHQAEGHQRVQNELDSILETINSLPEGQARIDSLNTIAWNVKDEGYKLALKCSEVALELSKNIDYTKGKIDAHYTLGQIHTNFAQDYTRGLEHLTTAVELVDVNQDPGKKISILLLIGYIHNRQENSPNATRFYNQALEVAEQHNRPRDYSDICTYLADVYEAKNDEQEAMVYYKKAYDLESENSFAETKSTVKVALGRYRLLLKDYEGAEKFYLMALQDFQNANVHRWAAYVYSSLGFLCLENKQAAKAISYGKQGLALAKKHKLPKEIADNHEMLSIVYDSIGNHKMALFHFKDFTAQQKSMFTLERSKEIAAIQSSYENVLKETELAQKNREKELELNRSQILFYASIAGLALLMVIVFFLVRAYRQKQKVNAELSDRVELKDLALSDVVKQLKNEVRHHKETQSLLSSSNTELTHFIYRTSHDLKGPLTAISGLSHIALTVSEEERKEVLHKIGATSSRLSKILDRLIQVSMLTEAPVDISNISLKLEVEDILKDLGEKGWGKDIQPQLEIDPQLHIQTDQRLLLLILSSLIENGMKYNDPLKAEAQLQIKALNVNTGVRIKVKDNGIGISSENQYRVFDMFYKNNLNHQGDGLGLYFVRKAVERLGGQITLRSQVGKGSEFSVFLPSHQSKASA